MKVGDLVILKSDEFEKLLRVKRPNFSKEVNIYEYYGLSLLTKLKIAHDLGDEIVVEYLEGIKHVKFAISRIRCVLYSEWLNQKIENILK